MTNLFTVLSSGNIGEEKKKKNHFIQHISSYPCIDSSGFTLLSMIYVPLISEIMVHQRMVLLLSQVVS